MTDLRSNNEFDSLESFFHEKLKDASFAREEGPWQKIEAELAQMEKEKRRRRFFWLFFSGIALLGGLAALWFFVLDEKFQSKDAAHKQTAYTSSTKTSSENTSPSKEIAPSINESSAQQNAIASENTQTEKTTNDQPKKDEVAADKQIDLPLTVPTEILKSSPGSSKIQLAACSKKANPAIFRKVPFAVIEVEGKDGVIRYFAETKVNDNALQTIRNAGFASAFVKKNFSAEDNSVTIKEAGAPENYQTSLAAAHVATQESQPAKNNTDVAAKGNTKENNSQADQGKASPSTAILAGETTAKHTSSTSQPSQTNAVEVSDNNSTKDNGVIKNENASVDPSQSSSANITGAPATNTTSVNNVNENTNGSPVAQETKTDSVPPIAAIETKKDSVPKKSETPDSSKTVTTDVSSTTFTPEWALLLLAGPNIFTLQAESNLYPTSGESQPISLNTELKVQFRLMKLLSFSGGVNYTSYSVKQDRTFFRFNKNQTNDYVFYSAFGPMAAPMSTLRDGYSMLAPFDTFPCYYSQSSKLNMINIPLEANLHFVNKSRIGVFLGLGANSSFAVSQHSTLTLHKEHFDNNISYNNVTVNPFSLALLFSLGCDVRVGKKLYLSFVPSYRYGVTNLSATNGTTFKPAYFSGNAGLKFKF